MQEKNKSFLKKLDELIALFEKLRDKATTDGIILENDPMYRNFDMLAGNYKMIKDTIPEELIEEIGEPIKEMISEMINQLKKDLDISDDNFDAGFKDDLQQIDSILRSKDLSEKEINDLLDKRADLKKDKG